MNYVIMTNHMISLITSSTTDPSVLVCSHDNNININMVSIITGSMNVCSYLGLWIGLGV